MGTPAEEVTKTSEVQTSEEILAAEAAEQEAAEATQVKEEADAKVREELEAEGKSPEEIDEVLKAINEGDELEIVREGEEETQPLKTQHQVDSAVRKRVYRLNRAKDKVVGERDESNAANVILSEQNKLLEMALEQERGKKSLLAQPNPEDFEDGISNPEFIKQNAAFNQQTIQQEVSKQVGEATKQTVQQSTDEVDQASLERDQTKHYERVNDLKVKDYDVREDRALEIFGNEVVNQVIMNFPKSHLMLYYLGTEKNAEEAKALAALLESSPVQGVAEFGRLQGELTLKPKSNSTPGPDDELEGGAKSLSKKRGPQGATYS